MHEERYDVSPEASAGINRIKKGKNKIWAVGTTVARILETVSTGDINRITVPATGMTDKFIYPPYEFKIVDRMITNFHLPSSTLLMLVCAFAGRDLVFKAYRKAIREKYRFYSYGDAMLVL